MQVIVGETYIHKVFLMIKDFTNIIVIDSIESNSNIVRFNYLNGINYYCIDTLSFLREYQQISSLEIELN